MTAKTRRQTKPAEAPAATGVIVWCRETRSLLNNNVYPNANDADDAIRKHLSQAHFEANVPYTYDKLKVTY